MEIRSSCILDTPRKPIVHADDSECLFGAFFPREEQTAEKGPHRLSERRKGIAGRAKSHERCCKGHALLEAGHSYPATLPN